MSISVIATVARIIMVQGVLHGQVADLSGSWNMAIQKRGGSTQPATLTLRQNGKQIMAVIRASGGEVRLKGNVEGNRLQLRGRKPGVPYTIDAECQNGLLVGTIRVLSVVRSWTGQRAASRPQGP